MEEAAQILGGAGDGDLVIDRRIIALGRHIVALLNIQRGEEVGERGQIRLNQLADFLGGLRDDGGKLLHGVVPIHVAERHDLVHLVVGQAKQPQQGFPADAQALAFDQVALDADAVEGQVRRGGDKDVVAGGRGIRAAQLHAIAVFEFAEAARKADAADDLHQRVKLRLALLVVRQHGENFVAKLKGQARFAADNLPRVQRGVDQRLRPLAGHISVLRQRAGENQREAQEQSQKKRVGLFHGSTSLSIGHNDAKQRQTWDLSASL